MDRLHLKAAGQSDVARVLLTGRRLRKALHAIDAEWRGWLALAAREAPKVEPPSFGASLDLSGIVFPTPPIYPMLFNFGIGLPLPSMAPKQDPPHAKDL
jgi:hypothetical protein